MKPDRGLKRKVRRVVWVGLLGLGSLAGFLLFFGLFALIASEGEPDEGPTNTLPALAVLGGVTLVLGLAFRMVDQRLNRERAGPE